MTASRQGTLAARRLRDVLRREFDGMPESEYRGHAFAQRLAVALLDPGPTTLSEYFRVYRLIVPRTASGRAGPRPLEEAWRARRLKQEGRSRGEIAEKLGFLRATEREAGIAQRNGEPGEQFSAALAAAEKRVTRVEHALARCEQRILDAGYEVPDWLKAPPGGGGGQVTCVTWV